ncbi:hypothetical protein ACQCX5_11200 [Propionibacteriaceae bacterium G57]|uniref:hypothetical protein n=1 Tax=Aestuariimicrobium sp. G57 TaxID=3418485 RepID=UPI003DA73E17
MSRIARIVILAVLAALVGTVPAGLVPTGVAHAALPASASTCTQSGQVWLVVVGPNGETVANTCVGNPSSGWQALQNAGISITQRSSNDGFICQLNGLPNRCIEGNEWTTADGYWQYYHASAGSSWTYSTRGAKQYSPKPGSVQGWCYSSRPNCSSSLSTVLKPAGLQPYVSAPPTTAKPTTTAPKPTTTAPRTTSAPKPAPTSRATSGATRTQATTAPTTVKATAPSSAASKAPTTASTSAPPSAVTPSAPVTSSIAAASTAATSPAGTASPTTVAAERPSSSGTGSPWAVAATVGLVAAGAAGAVVAVRRRRADGLDDDDLA